MWRGSPHLNRAPEICALVPVGRRIAANTHANSGFKTSDTSIGFAVGHPDPIGHEPPQLESFTNEHELAQPGPVEVSCAKGLKLPDLAYHAIRDDIEGRVSSSDGS